MVGGSAVTPMVSTWVKNLSKAGNPGPILVIDTVFGANLTLFDGMKAQPKLNDCVSKVRLLNLRYQGKKYVVSARGPSLVG